MGRGGLEPPTSRLSGVRSNHLSYRPASRSRAKPGIASSSGRSEGAAPSGASREDGATVRCGTRSSSVFMKGYEGGLARYEALTEPLLSVPRHRQAGVPGTSLERR